MMRLIFNINSLREQLNYYHILTGNRIAIFDDNFHEIISCPEGHNSFCQTLREDPLANEHCKACDLNAGRICKETKKLHVYNCHIGLTDAVFPILDNNNIIGYVMTGQILNTKDRHELWETVKDNLNDYKVDQEILYKHFMNTPRFTDEKINAMAKTMEIMAKFLYNEKMIMQVNSPIAAKIEEYIYNNVSKRIDTSSLCSIFHMGKSSMYRLSNESFGMGITDYVRLIRIYRAKELLTDTKLAIYEISEMVGISDYNYFTKVFKSIVGLTPRQFRNKSVN
ncbi:PocR ligand-binding domain-containing protein [Paenibacillus sp. CMAA1364]